MRAKRLNTVKIITSNIVIKIIIFLVRRVWLNRQRIWKSWFNTSWHSDSKVRFQIRFTVILGFNDCCRWKSCLTKTHRYKWKKCIFGYAYKLIIFIFESYPLCESFYWSLASKFPSSLMPASCSGNAVKSSQKVFSLSILTRKIALFVLLPSSCLPLPRRCSLALCCPLSACAALKSFRSAYSKACPCYGWGIKNQRKVTDEIKLQMATEIVARKYVLIILCYFSNFIL